MLKLLRHARIKGSQQDLGPFPRMQVKRRRGIFRSSELLLRRVHIGTMTKVAAMWDDVSMCLLGPWDRFSIILRVRENHPTDWGLSIL